MTELSPISQLERDIRQAMGAERFKLRRRLQNIKEAQRAGKPFDRNLSRLAGEIEQSVRQRKDRVDRVPTIEYDPELPITAKKEEIAAAIREHQVVVICGETGSGKSTQIPKICLEIGRGIDGMIGHTQPRRIAARAISARIAEELKVPLGQEVGFKIRFTDTTKPGTYVKLMTDGILLAESAHDRFLNQYDTIIIDEAHERSLNIDFLLGYIKRLLPKRRDLRLIITSATIDAARFSEHFGSSSGPAPVIEVSGRAYPVETRYRPMLSEDPEEEGEPDPIGCLKAAVDELADERPVGDMLVFLPTERDIRDAAQSLRGHRIPGDAPGRMTEILPLYGRLSTKEQNRVFQRSGWRRIVLATNVAESSLTVPGIRYVIDTGTARISRYSARSQVQRLPIEPISQASADQRKGRCGRIGPGVCLRLYSEDDFLSRDRFTPPEIQRTNLASVILQTISLNLGNLEEFPFLDPPKSSVIRDGYKTLFELGALDEQERLTDIGRQLSRLPVDPRIGRMILAGQAENCLHEVLIIASALELQDPRERPLEKQQAADAAHEKFRHEDSDFFGYLKLWDFYHKLRNDVSRSRLRKACRQHFLSYNRLREWADIYQQLLRFVEEAGFKLHKRKDDSEAIHRALLTGLLSNIAYRAETYEYTGSGGTKFHLWPGSGLFEKKPKWVFAAELVETSRRYLRTAAKLNPNWIEPLAGHLINKSYSEPHWDPELGSVMAYEKVTLFGLTIVPRRRVRYGPIDPAKSRELFIQQGLVEGEIGGLAPHKTQADDLSSQRPTTGTDRRLVRRLGFLEHNRKLLEEVAEMEAKSRRRDLLLGEEARYEFYDKRLPAEVWDVGTLQKWWKDAQRTEPRLLFMSKSDLLKAGGEELADDDFPNTLTIDRMRLPLEYHLEPGSEQDGITLVVPKEGVNQLDPHRLGWLVPGLLEEKITALIKSLPKDLRRAFVPAPDTAKEVLKTLRFAQGDMTAEVAKVLSRIAGEPIPASAFDATKLPLHLRMNVKVVDQKGESVAAGRDLGVLRGELGCEASASFAALDDRTWNRPDLSEWNFGDLPAQVQVNRGGVALRGYPTLIDRGETVSLQLADTPEKASALIRRGVRRLFILKMKKHLKTQVDYLPNLNQILLHAATLPGGAGGFRTQLAECIADRALFPDDNIPKKQAEFENLLKVGKNRISAAVQEVAHLVKALMENYHAIQLPLEGKLIPAQQSAVNDLREQLSYLVEEGFLANTPWPWLWQYPRYFRAMKMRLEKLSAGGLARDRECHAIIKPLWERYLFRAEEHREREVYDPHLVHYRWMIEELRVSLFAQKLGTGITVSEKRLEDQWRKVKQ